ncbi:MAG TPA: prepilin-type N-terminal cleavage/methylation domain-containing protein [Acidiferrobacterales bacterium]|nr:prepilin-type N-terminal cleavage/methylation domain-containing protein [Acidiferrobacterales bacterium]
MRAAHGFTLVELLVVLTLIAILASLVAPVVSSSIVRAKEATLKENLFILRKAIDDYYADQGDYPTSLQQLVEKRYIRKPPVDPLTDRSDSWVEVHAEDDGKQGGVIDVRSGSEEKSGDGVAYRDW